jgi:hypothetical protein
VLTLFFYLTLPGFKELFDSLEDLVWPLLFYWRLRPIIGQPRRFGLLVNLSLRFGACIDDFFFFIFFLLETAEVQALIDRLVRLHLL